jgi:hypothetical protein
VQPSAMVQTCYCATTRSTAARRAGRHQWSGTQEDNEISGNTGAAVRIKSGDLILCHNMINRNGVSGCLDLEWRPRPAGADNDRTGNVGKPRDIAEYCREA